MFENPKLFRVTVASAHVSAFLRECEASEWYACDTGERVMTDDGPDGEAVLLVEPAQRQAVEPRLLQAA